MDFTPDDITTAFPPPTEQMQERFARAVYYEMLEMFPKETAYKIAGVVRRLIRTYDEARTGTIVQLYTGWVDLARIVPAPPMFIKIDEKPEAHG